MSHTGAFAALARYLDRNRTIVRCQDHPGCQLPAGHQGPPLLSRTRSLLDQQVTQ